MKLKGYFTQILLVILVNHSSSRRLGTDFKKEPIKVVKGIRARGEVMENLFSVFDPPFLSYVWPKIKNGVHLNIGHHCWDEVSIFLKDLAEGRSWAYRAADASGRYQSALFEGKRFWLGSKEQCLKLDQSYVSTDSNETWGEFYSSEYLNTLLRREKEFGGDIDEWRSFLEKDELMRRVVEADNEAPVPLAYTALQVMLNVTKLTMPKSYDITLGVCLPRSCAAEDVVSVINFSIMLNDHLKTNRTVSRSVKITSLRHIESSYDIQTDIGMVLLMLVTASLAILTIVATIVDFDLIKFRPYTKALSFDLHKYNNDDRNFVEKNNNVERKESYAAEADALSIKHFSDLKKVVQEKAIPPTVTLDVLTPEGVTSCNRCGKYKKQCANPMQKENIPPCPRLKYNSCASFTTEYKKDSGIGKSLLLSFSLKHSWMRIFNTGMANKDLAAVHLVKIVSILWIIFIHVAVIVSYISENSGAVDNNNNIYYMLSTGTLAYDTLFFVSGLFSAQHFFYLKSRYSVEEVADLGGVCGQALQLICFITNRAIRLLPPYIYTIFLASVVSRISRDTAVLMLPEKDYDNCGKYWWRNLLFITNFTSKDEQCMQVSWYLSAETQMHMLGALLCLLLATGKRRVSALLAVTLLFGATAFDFTTALTDFKERATSSFALYSALINRPCARVVPYFVGVSSGWLLHIMGRDCSVSKISSRCLWLASVIMFLSSIILPWVPVRWVSSWVHITWPLTLLWPALLCATKYSGKTRCLLRIPFLAGASRLCYSMFLLHGVVARSVLLSADTPLCSHFLCIFCYFTGCTLLTLAAALCLSLLVEMPSCCILRRVSDCTYR